MLFLTKLHLQNFCNYDHHTFDFKKGDGDPYRFICFFGPNGIGKTTILEAISLLTMNQSGRDPENVKRSLRKYVRNKDYDPSYEHISGHTYNKDFAKTYTDNLAEMIIEGTYEMDGKTYVVRLTQNGFERNDLGPEGNGIGPWGDDHLLYRQRVAHIITSDSDLSLSKFQLRRALYKPFEEVTSAIMRFPTDCIAPAGLVPIDEEYITDFIIEKKDRQGSPYKIHFKRMSLGEKKIAKSFSQLLNLLYDLEYPDPGEIPMPGWPRLLLLDNIEMHIYYDRHVIMVDSMKKYFPNQQIFATTHSGVLIPRFLRKENDQATELYVNLERIVY